MTDPKNPDTNTDPPGMHPAPEPEPIAIPRGEPTSNRPSRAAQARPAGIDTRGRVERGRASRLWTALIVSAIVLIALIIFIAQNSAATTVHFLGLDGRISLALALLLSAIAGILLAAIPGTIRILQLRHALKKNVRNLP